MGYEPEEKEEDEMTYRRPFATRLADQLVPSLIMAFAMGFIGVKVLESKMDAVVTAAAEQRRILDSAVVDITRTQERQASIAERLSSAVIRTDQALDRMDARLIRLEDRLRDHNGGSTR